MCSEAYRQSRPPRAAAGASPRWRRVRGGGRSGPPAGMRTAGHARSAPGASAGTAGWAGGTGRDRRYGSPSGGRGSASPLLGQSDIARSAWAVMVSDGLTPRLARPPRRRRRAARGGRTPGGTGRSPRRAGVSPIAAPPRMCAVIGMLNDLGPARRRACRRSPRRAAGRPRCRPGSRSGWARRGPAPVASRAGRPGRAASGRGERVVQRLHDQRDDRPLRPAAHGEHPGGRYRAAAAACRASAADPARAAVGQHVCSRPIALEPLP